MLQEVIELQNRAILNIIKQFEVKDNIVFKSPTGSGKTYMIASVMDKILDQNEDIIFLVSSLSKSELAEQNYHKFNEYIYKGIFKNINPYLISSDSTEGGIFIPVDYNVYVLPRDLYKKKSKLKDEKYLERFLENIIKVKNKKIFFVKDECHIATNNLDELSDKYFTKILNCSATPKLKKNQKCDVEIKEFEAVNTRLIKRVEYNDEDIDLEKILIKFKEIKRKYEDAIKDKNFGKSVNPCLIIQISNKEKADEEVENIKKKLNKTEFQNLQWMLIVDDNKKCMSNNIINKLPVIKWKDEAKKDKSTIDIIIFKMVITEGWDIPRACMLYQVRNSKSEQLDEQVIGRIRRNPKLLNFEELSKENQELLSTAYVWGIRNTKNNETIEVKLIGNTQSNEIQQELKLKTTCLKRLEKIKNFNISNFLEKFSPPVVPNNIFELYKDYAKAPLEIKELCDLYSKDYSSWFKFTNNFSEIIKESKNRSCNYSENMEITTDENNNEIKFSLPLISYYITTENQKEIDNWIWERTDKKEDFSFDSEAEKEWCEILINFISKESKDRNKRVIKDIIIKNLFKEEKKYLLGKNYLQNSNIKYEYYLYGIHSSYPDFVMKDWLNRVHLFETKSLNKSNKIYFDENEYNEKINALKECYKHSSRLTGYYFYIPIKKGKEWVIFQYFNGIESILTKEECKNFIINGF